MAQYNKLVCKGITLGLMALLILACGLLPSEITSPEVPEPADSGGEDPTPTVPLTVAPGLWACDTTCTIEGVDWRGSVEFDVSKNGRAVTRIVIDCMRDRFHCPEYPFLPPGYDCSNLFTYTADFSADPLDFNELQGDGIAPQFVDDETDIRVIWLFSADRTKVTVAWALGWEPFQPEVTVASGGCTIER